MGEGLKNLRRAVILAAKREGICTTPPPTWKFGAIHHPHKYSGSRLVENTINTNNLSARKLGATLWWEMMMMTQMEPQFDFGVGKDGPNLDHQNSRVTKQQIADSRALHDRRAKKVEQAQQPLSCSTMEMAPHRPAISPTGSFGSNGKHGESSHSLKTSTELLKVLNRIWSLEEKHASDLSLVKKLKRELDQSRAQIKELQQQREIDQKEIDKLAKYRVAKKEGGRFEDAVELVEEKLEAELKLRRHSEKLQQRLAQELSETKKSFSNTLRELESEKKTRTLLEDLCDEFAKGTGIMNENYGL